MKANGNGQIASTSGPGRYSKRVDLTKAKRVENLSSGKYGERAELEQLGQGASMKVSEAAQVPMDIVNKQPMPSYPIQNVGAFDPTQRPNEPITTGVDNTSDGTPGTSANIPPFDGPDSASILVRAMYMNNPTPQLRRVLETFYAEGR